VGDFPIGFGRYQLVERLALGGMAELFVATAPGEHGFQKKVVIKRLLPHLVNDETYNAMFIDEAKLTARLVHPKIAQTFELGKVDDQLFIAMEHVDGIDVLALLREFAARRRRVEPQLAAWIAHETLDALDYAHNLAGEDGKPLGIVHRDVSFKNIMIAFEGDVKLTDFGIAKAKGFLIDNEGEVVAGKADYMSPEQADFQITDKRSDIFSGGVVLAHLLLGKNIFKGATTEQSRDRVMKLEVPDFRKLDARVDDRLNEILHRALARKLDERYPNADELLYDLEHYIYHKGYGPTNETLGRFIRELFGQLPLQAVQTKGTTQVLEHTARLAKQPESVT
jgi:serine/threonine-protein kinase